MHPRSPQAPARLPRQAARPPRARRIKSLTLGTALGAMLAVAGAPPAESLTLSGTAADLVVDLEAGDQDATLRPHSPGRLEIVGAGFPDTDFPIPSSSLTVLGGDGRDIVRVDGLIDMAAASLTIESERIHVLPGAHVQSGSDVALTARELPIGVPGPPQADPDAQDPLEVVAASADVEITVTGATIDSDFVILTAEASPTLGAPGESFVRVEADASAVIEVVDSNLTAAGDIVLFSKAELDATAAAEGTIDNSDLNGADGSIGKVVVSSTSSASVTGDSVIQALGGMSVVSDNDVLAAGSGRADLGNFGGGVAIVEVNQSGKAFVDVNDVDWTAQFLSVTSRSTNDVSSASASSPDGYDPADEGAGAPSPGDRTDGDAAAIPFAGALADTRFQSEVLAYVQGELSFTSSGSLIVDALSTHESTASADGSTADAGGTGVANAVAVNRVDATTRAWLGDSVSGFAGSGVRVKAAESSPDVFAATATPGTSAPPQPDSLELNAADSTRVAEVGDQVEIRFGRNLTLHSDDVVSVIDLVKQVINDDAGTASVSDFVPTGSGAMGVSAPFTLSEEGPGGYRLVSTTCDDAPGQVTEVALATGQTLTCTLVNDDDRLRVTKVASLTGDVYGDGGASPGDTLRYEVEIQHLGATLPADDIVLVDVPDAKSALVPGSVSVSQGSVVSGNGAGDAAVELDVGDIVPGDVLTFAFDVKVLDVLTPDEIATGLSNQAVVTGSNVVTTRSDDPGLPGPEDPTRTPLADICDGVTATTGCRVNGGVPGPCKGTGADDVIIGTSGADRILGKGGDDFLYGGGGGDLICAGGGADNAYGEDGKDRIDGGGGADLLLGGDGRDLITGAGGNDDLDGGRGRDRLDGGSGNDDFIDGGLGSDLCTDPGAATFVRCGPSCGLGFELALLLGPLAWLRRRRRRS